MKVYEAIANAFIKEGTTTLFGLLGDGQMYWWAEMAKHQDLNIVDVRDEGAALTMAEGWAMATGNVGVCSCTQGPGLARMATALIVATRSHTPIVVLTAKVPLNNDRQIQYLNQDQFVTATGAGYIEVLTPSYAENAVRQAFYRARRESRPIVLAVPKDVQTMDCEAEGVDYRPSSEVYSGQQAIRPALAKLKEAAGIIAHSKKPVVIVGRGAMSAPAKAAAERLAKRIGALIATTLIAKGTLSESEYFAGISGQYSSREAIGLFAEADCVIAIGGSLSMHTTSGGYLYPKAKIIHIDTNQHLLMGDERGADCYVQGDATETTQELNELLEKNGVGGEGYRTAEVRKLLRESGRDPAEFEIEPGTVDPREAARVLDEHLPSSVGLVSSGNAHACAFRVLNMNKPRPLYVYTTAFGCIGQALATGIGIAAGSDFPICCVDGDGSAMQAIQELDTVGRMGLKFLYVVMNDEAYGAEYQKLLAHKKDKMLSVVRSPDFAMLGRACGCEGRSARTLEELAKAVDEFMAGSGPMVVDLRISKNVISIPYRRLHFGMDV